MNLLDADRGWSLRGRAESAERTLTQALADVRAALKELDKLKGAA